MAKIEKGWKGSVGQSGVGIAQFIEEGVGARFERRETRSRRVVEQSADEIDGHGRRSIAKDLRENRIAARGESDARARQTLFHGCALICGKRNS